MIQIIHYADNIVGMNIENSPDKFQVSESKFPQIDFNIHIAFVVDDDHRPKISPSEKYHRYFEQY